MEKLPVILICFTERIRNVSCGSKHTLFLTDNKKVFACGDNSQGQLGTGNKKNSYLPIKLTFFENMLVQKICARDFSAILTESGELFVCGDVSQSSNYLPEKMEVPSNNKIEDLDIGFGFGVCLDYDGNVYSWGNNKNGELGLGDYENKEKFNNIVSLNGRRIKGIHCGANYVMVLGNTISPGENHFFNSSRLDGFDGIKENNLLRNRTYNENESISKRNRQYLKSYDNGINNNPNNNTKNNCLNIYTNETNEISTYKNNATLDKNINSDTKNSRLGKSLTPIRHLTSEEIKSRQKVSIFHNVNSQKPTNINEPEVVELSENQRSAETDIIEENYMINTIDAQKIKNLIKHNENIIKETEITQNQIISNKYNKNNTKDEEKLMPNVIISNDTSKFFKKLRL